jgi:hypothetical protein
MLFYSSLFFALVIFQIGPYFYDGASLVYDPPIYFPCSWDDRHASTPSFLLVEVGSGLAYNCDPPDLLPRN